MSHSNNAGYLRLFPITTAQLCLSNKRNSSSNYEAIFLQHNLLKFIIWNTEVFSLKRTFLKNVREQLFTYTQVEQKYNTASLGQM